MSSISTFGQTALRSAQLRSLESSLATANAELASGKKDDVAKTIGVELINLQTIRNQFSENQSFIQSIDLFDQRYDLIDSAFNEAVAGVDSLVAVGALNSGQARESAGTVPLVAASALDRIITSLNVEFGGRQLFGGAVTDSAPFQLLDNQNTGGISPNELGAQITQGTTGVPGLGTTDLTAVSSVAEATELLERFDDVFDGTNAGNPAPATQAFSFEQTIYNGELDGTLLSIRLPGNSVETQINREFIQGIRDVFQGAYILSNVDLEAISDEDGYRELLTGETSGRDGALDLIAKGLTALRQARADLGLRAQTVEAARTNLEVQQVILNNQIVELEGVDRAEVTTRLLDLETQLQASYTVTGRLAQLRLFNFVR